MRNILLSCRYMIINAEMLRDAKIYKFIVLPREHGRVYGAHALS